MHKCVRCEAFRIICMLDAAAAAADDDDDDDDTRRTIHRFLDISVK